VLPLIGIELTGAAPSGYEYGSAAELKGMSKPLAQKVDAKTSLGDLANFGPGDIMQVPPKIPHQVLIDPNTQITYFVLKVKE
jgi:hypothetical protein